MTLIMLFAFTVAALVLINRLSSAIQGNSTKPQNRLEKLPEKIAPKDKVKINADNVCGEEVLKDTPTTDNGYVEVYAKVPPKMEYKKEAVIDITVDDSQPAAVDSKKEASQDYTTSEFS